ncbi:MAG: EAL domain-containing protein [Candidatus Methanoperedens sp.]|nr:EAL domain-containing protein [Candidatus Methanoperedens sp.]
MRHAGQCFCILLEKQVLSRLSHLSDSVSYIGLKRDHSARVSIPGKDELGNLSHEINRMLAALEQSELELQKARNELEIRVQERTAALTESESRFRALTESTSSAIFIYQQNKFLYVNPATQKITGYSEFELQGMNIWDLTHPDHRETIKQRIQIQQKPRGVFREEVKLITKQGEIRWVDFTAASIELAGQPVMLGTAFDITDRKKAEDRLLYDAFHDALTGLPNRNLFMELVGRAFERAKRYTDKTCAVIFMDLDNFKQINDSLGHTIGDKLLIEASKRLTSKQFRAADTVARLGGDEFVILIEDLQNPSQVIHVSKRIQQEIGKPFNLDGHEIFITTAIGIATFENSYNHPEEMLRDADTAMYRAKSNGKGQFMLFDSSMHADVAIRLKLESDLRHAIENQEFKVLFQPIISSETRKIIGAESLIRWSHPTRGMVSPVEFIPVAEETGLIVPIGEWVLQSVCQQVKSWHDTGNSKIWVSVNFSARQFRDKNLVMLIKQTLAKSSLSPIHLVGEITESVAMQDLDYTIKVMNILREIGLRFAIDDFGTGYSSLSYLNKFPISTVKIDRSFVKKLPNDLNSTAIISAIMTIAHKLNLKIVAEGVETEEQLAFLQSQQCDEIQGFLFYKPLPAEDLVKLLQKQA